MFSFEQIVQPVLGVGLSWISRDSLPHNDGTLHLDGLNNSVEVFRDQWGVPHLYADNIGDLLFAQGYLHAQDRLWQMDFYRRLVTGRLAEVLGREALPYDRWIRVLGLRNVSEREPALLTAEVREMIDVYAAGVNARIEQGHLPIEFFILGYKPEPWTALDSLSWSKMIAWSLSGNWESELVRAELIDRLGPERAAELELEDHQPWPNWLSLIGRDFRAIDQAANAQIPSLPTLKNGVGSNNWVVSGERTQNGMPILANDMHLPLTMPAVWYENHLCAGDLDVSGVSFPGVPLVIAGHNRSVAWGYTAGFADTQDLYIEHVQRTLDGRVLYEYHGEWKEAQVRQERIGVRSGETITEEIVHTCHGPVINPLIQNYQVNQTLAMRWTSLDPEDTIVAMVGINQARTSLEIREALKHWCGPVVNVVYADTEGNIGYSLAGKVPVRAQGDGRIPVPGWTGDYEWVGTIPFEEMPHLYNPPQGFIATANNRIADASYPYHLSDDYVIGDRAMRIAELIGSYHPLDITRTKQMQYDQVSPSARWIAYFLGRLTVDDPELEIVVRMMRDWDGDLRVDRPEVSIHEIFMRRIIPLILRDKLGDLTPHYAGQGPTPLLAEATMWGFRSWEWLERTMTIPNSPWFDLGNGETRDDIMRIALRESVDYLKERLGDQVQDWTWGKIHRLSFNHVLSQVKSLQQFFSRGPFPVGGDGTTIWATTAPLNQGDGSEIIGPPFRFIADMNDLDHCLGVLAPGQSGLPASPHYDDQINDWFQGEYHPMWFARKDVEQGAKHRLLLVPSEPKSAA